jgi:hypothetical protein
LKLGPRVPMTARWYKPVTSLERSGFLNIATPKMGARLKYWLFFPLVVWGNVVNIFTGYYYDNFDFLDQITSLYDKLAHRPMPGGRVWARPG